MPEITISQGIITVIIAFLTSAISVGGIFHFYLRKRIDVSFNERFARQKTEREKMEIFLTKWAERRTDYSDEWAAAFNKSMRDIALWCPNDVLYHIGMYLTLFGKSDEAQKHFGEAIICYRRTLGYKNRWWDDAKVVTPEHILKVYCAGDEEKVK